LKDYRDLEVYLLSQSLVARVLAATRRFPRSERFELVSQIRRAAISIQSNLSEGYSRKSRKEYIQFVSVAYGSCRELGTHLEISRGQDYISENEYRDLDALRDRVSAMLWRLRESLNPIKPRPR
jgi:four helix bundle protein